MSDSTTTERPSRKERALLDWICSATNLLCDLAEDSGKQISAEQLRATYAAALDNFYGVATNDEH